MVRSRKKSEMSKTGPPIATESADTIGKVNKTLKLDFKNFKKVKKYRFLGAQIGHISVLRG